MLYGCNYSEQLIELLEETPSLCDYIKIGAFGDSLSCLEKAGNYKPLLIHGFGWYERGGMPDVSVLDFNLMNKLMLKYKTPFLGMHAIAFEKDVVANNDILKHMVHVFKDISNKIQTELIIENMDYSRYYDYETTVIETVKPDFLYQLITETGLNLLLDISHALVSSYQLGMTIYEYLERLPLDAVREIHVTGSFFSNDIGYKDIHGIIGEEDYNLVQFIANHKKIKNSRTLKMITLEYGNCQFADKNAIEYQLKQLKSIFG